jgi:hypothetical protein
MKITHFDIKYNKQTYRPEITFVLEGTITPENVALADLFGEEGYAIFGKEIIDLIKEKVKQHETRIRVETNNHGNVSYFW